jgi:hypothetical protein
VAATTIWLQALHPGEQPDRPVGEFLELGQVGQHHHHDVAGGHQLGRIGRRLGAVGEHRGLARPIAVPDQQALVPLRALRRQPCGHRNAHRAEADEPIRCHEDIMVGEPPCVHYQERHSLQCLDGVL